MKPNQPRGGRLESAGVEVEPAQPFLEVNVKPLTPSIPCLLGRRGNQFRSNAHVPRRRFNHYVLNPSVRTAIPDHVDKSN
jgi:hypothetical protein